jgi:hypothetical protein
LHHILHRFTFFLVPLPDKRGLKNYFIKQLLNLMFLGLVNSVIPRKSVIFGGKIVGVAGFEPATSCSQSRRDNRATLYPEKIGLQKYPFFTITNKKLTFYFAERKGFEPPVPVKAQLLSREPRSATLAPLQYFSKQLK